MKIEIVTTKRVIVLKYVTLSDKQIGNTGECDRCPCRGFCNSDRGAKDFCVGMAAQYSRDWREEYFSYPLNIEEVLREIRKNPIRVSKRID